MKTAGRNGTRGLSCGSAPSSQAAASLPDHFPHPVQHHLARRHLRHGDLIINKIFATTEIKDLLTFSWSSVITVILIAIVLNYLIFLGKNTLHEIYGEDYEVGIIPTFVTLSTLFLWGLFVFTALIIMNANYNGLLMVMGA